MSRATSKMIARSAIGTMTAATGRGVGITGWRVSMWLECGDNWVEGGYVVGDIVNELTDGAHHYGVTVHASLW